MSLPLRILYVEDNEGDVTLFRVALSDSGTPHTIVVKTDGEQAVNYIAEVEANRQLPPDLILLDLNLPRVHGFEVLQVVRQSRQLSSAPVVVLSSSQQPRDVKRAYELKANAYVMKPSNLNQFFALAKGIAVFWSMNVAPLDSAI